MPTEHCHPSKLSAPRRGELHPASGRRGFIRMRPVIRLLPVVVLLPVISAGTPRQHPALVLPSQLISPWPCLSLRAALAPKVMKFCVSHRMLLCFTLRVCS